MPEGQTLINTWETDPGQADQPIGGRLIQLPIPSLNSNSLPTVIDINHSIPEAGIYEAGTPEFLYWNLASILMRSTDFWSKYLTGITWKVGNILPVKLDFGVDLNANYDRIGLKFFHAKIKEQLIHTAESPDIVQHELGHAVLDALKPQLWHAASKETSSFHESFADISAILCALQLQTLRMSVLAETGGNLYSSSSLSRLAEQFGWAKRQFNSASAETDCLRNAVNSFFYQSYTSLPAYGPASILSSDDHSLSRVFTAAFFETLANMFNLQVNQDEEGLLQASKDIGTILVNAIKVVAVVQDFFSQLAANMINAANTLFPAINYGQAIRSAFVRRGIISPATSFNNLLLSADINEPFENKNIEQDLPLIELPVSEYGLGMKKILVHANFEKKDFVIKPSVITGSAFKTKSNESTAKYFFEDILRRGCLKNCKNDESEGMSMDIIRPTAFNSYQNHTHQLVKTTDGYLLQRIRFN